MQDANAAGRGGLLDGGGRYPLSVAPLVWSERQRLVPGDVKASKRFGLTVSLGGDTMLVGAPGDDEAGAYSGAVYVFVRSATSWTQQQKLVASDGSAGDLFGWSVSLSGETALLGAYGDDDGGNGSGSAYAFVRNAVSWVQQDKLVAGDGAAGDLFGYAVSLSGETALVGAWGDADAGSGSGSAYFFGRRIAGGDQCAGDDACASRLCVDGVCCESACDGSCETCNLAGLEGICSPTARGSAPAPACNGYLCNGAIRECPSDCAGDEDCAATHHCPDALGCAPKKVDGTHCGGSNVCLSDHCVDGVCCAETCDEGCGSCNVVGLEGACTPSQEGQPGTPSCAPFMCGGNAVSCPSGCRAHGDCTQGGHCDNGVCQVDRAQGDACSEDDACLTGHCADGLCCLSETCGAYRCGLAGACQTSCSSSAQCAGGYQCDSVSKCVPSDAIAASETEAGSCHLASVSESRPVPIRWRGFGAVAMLIFLGLARRRRALRALDQPACRTKCWPRPG